MDTSKSYLDLLIEKKYMEAYQVANDEYVNNPTEFNLRNRADSSLCLKNYEDALRDYLEVIQITEGRADADFLGAGTSYWLIGYYSEAIDTWKKGLNTKYTDAAGGVEVPAALYFAAVSQKNESLEKEANKLLRKRWKSKAALNWPGSIAGYLLGEITIDNLINSAISQEFHQTLQSRHLCQAYFYLAVKGLKEGNKLLYLDHLRLCASSNMGYLEQEYFLAIGELDKITN